MNMTFSKTKQVLALGGALLISGLVAFHIQANEKAFVAAYEPALACSLVLKGDAAAEDRVGDDIYEGFCHNLADQWTALNRPMPDTSHALHEGYRGVPKDEDAWLATIDILVKVNGNAPLPPKA